MGYALFTARKLSLQSKINSYNLQLMQIANKEEQLTQKLANFKKSQDRIDAKQAKANCKLQNQQTMNDAVSSVGTTLRSSSGRFGLTGFVGGLFGLGMSAGSACKGDYLDFKSTVNNIKDTMTDAKQNVDKNNIETEMAIEQQKLDTEKERINTLLQAAQAELQTVQEAEKQGIKNATPKYCA